MPRHLALRPYVIGFALSIALTLGAYYAVVGRLFSGSDLIMLIVGLGVIQLLVQLFAFLHLGSEKRPHWNVGILAFTIMVVGIIAGGSLWIMHNLNYNMLNASPEEMNSYMMDHDSL